MPFVAYTMRDAVVRIMSARGGEPHEKGNITRLRLDPKRPPKTDWRAFDAMSEEERH
jgi:hypothetical protein